VRFDAPATAKAGKANSYNGRAVYVSAQMYRRRCVASKVVRSAEKIVTYAKACAGIGDHCGQAPIENAMRASLAITKQSTIRT